MWPALVLMPLLASAPAQALRLGSNSGGAGQIQEAPLSATPLRMLYVLRTWHGSYGTRLPAVLKTWASHLPDDSLMVIGDEPSNLTSVHIAKECYYKGKSFNPGTSFDHNMGLCCKTAEAIAHALKERPNWDWLFMADDDHYIVTRNLEATLANYDASKPMAIGARGCLLENCTVPGMDPTGGRFCGGGGYVLSRAGAAALVGDSDEAFKKEHWDISAEFLGEEDTATSCMVQRKHIEMVHLLGTYGWRQAPAHNDAKGNQLPYLDHLEPEMWAPLYKTEPRAVVLHYLSPAELEAYHREILRSREQRSLLSTASRTFRERRSG